MFTISNLTPTKTAKEKGMKFITVVVAVSTVFNLSLVGVFVNPQPATAAPSLTEHGSDSSNSGNGGNPKKGGTIPPPGPGPTVTAVPGANPSLGQSCGLDIGLVIDVSGSVNSAEMTQMKNALTNFTNAFTGTPTQFSLVRFGTNSAVVQSFTSDISVINNKITNDIPSGGSGQTNWDSGLARSFDSFGTDHKHRTTKPDLMVIATDGSPNRWGYPSADPTFDWDTGLSMAVGRANLVKAAGTRIVAIGIGDDPFDPATPAEKLVKLQSISGPSVATTPGTITTTTDVIKTTDFTGIGDALASFVQELCGGKILVQKQYDTNNDGQVDVDGTTSNVLLADWTFDVNGSASNPAPQTTSNTGTLEFGNLTPGSGYSVVEAAQPNTQLTSARCVNGVQEIGAVDLGNRTVTGLTMGIEDTISCTFVNAPSTGTLRVMKEVVGSAEPASSWQIHVTSGGNEVSGSPQPGSTAGTDYTLPAGSYTISETGPSSYTASFSSSCANGVATVAAGQTTTCTITNTLIPVLNPVTTISLDKQGSATVTAGANLTYALAWSVAGNAPATNAVITDPIPANTTFVSADNGGTVSSGVVSWNLGTKNPGDSGTVSLVVRVNSPLVNGTVITNTGTFDTNQTAPVSDPVSTTVQSSPSLSITKTNNLTTFINPGTQVTYTVVVSNASNATDNANAVVLTDTLPAGFTFSNGGGSSKTFNLGTIAPGVSVTTTYVVDVSADHAAGTFANDASAKASNTSEVKATSNVEVRTPQILAAETNPNLVIKKSVNKANPLPGDTVTYTIVVENAGNADATNVVVTDSLPKNLTYVHAKGQTRTWNLGTIKAGASKTFHYDVKVKSDAKRGQSKNLATVTADKQTPRQASATLNVRQPEVKGLATTGTSTLDYVFMLGGALLSALGIVGLKRKALRA